MNNIIKAALKVNSLRNLLHPLKSPVLIHGGKQQSQFARNLWYLSNSNGNQTVHYSISNKLVSSSSEKCSCGCGKHGVHTKAEKELVEFLTDEILAERKSQKGKTIPTELDGFSVNLNGAEVTLTKKIENEVIKITFNVNHTVDTDSEPEMNPQMDKPDTGELKSKPSFKIDLINGNTTVSLVCSFIGPDQQQDGYNDVFGIDEISIYDGEWNENVYAVSGEVVDSYLYDLLMNYLDEKGVTNDFIEKLSEFSTLYEHSAYIGLLEGLSKFATGK